MKTKNSKLNKVTPACDPILIVCRQEQTIAALANVFSQHNETLMTAESPSDAWECLKAGSISAIILDLTSPMLEDISLIPRVRACTETFDIPFLYLVRKDFELPTYSRYGDIWVNDAWLGLPTPSTQVRNVVRQLIARCEAERQKDTTEEVDRMTVDIDEDEFDLPAKKSARAKSKGKDEDEDIEEDEDDETGSRLNVVVNRPPSGILSGQLEAIEVSKVLTVIEPLALSGTLTVTNGDREGFIYFEKGRVLHAVLADIKGPDALFLLFHMKEGTFAFEQGEVNVKRTVQGNTMSLLLEGLRQMDEAKDAIQRLKDNRAARKQHRESSVNMDATEESPSPKKKKKKKIKKRAPDEE